LRSTTSCRPEEEEEDDDDDDEEEEEEEEEEEDETLLEELDDTLLDELESLLLEWLLDELLDVFNVGSSIALVSSDTAAALARSRPFTAAIDPTVMVVPAIIVPLKLHETPRSAEVPASQKMLAACAPLARTTERPAAIIKLVPCAEGNLGQLVTSLIEHLIGNI
jgi:hypothetical protein